MEEFINALHHFNIYDEALVDKFKYLMDNICCPSEVFDYMANGSFKECYELNDDYVIKFASCDNRSVEELSILDEAHNQYIENLFIPTVGFPLGVLLPHDYIDEDLDYCFIQPKIKEVCGSSYSELLNFRFKEAYEQKPAGNIPYQIAKRLKIYNREWIEAVIDKYGEETFYDLYDFTVKYNIIDLHDENIGYDKDNNPVIIDWISYREEY